MLFARDTTEALVGVAALVNTERGDVDELLDVAALGALLDELRFSGRRAGTTDELEAIRRLRGRLGRTWDDPSPDAIVALVNGLLAEADAFPRLVRHDDWDWHLHLTDQDAPLEHRWGTEAAMALAELVRSDDLGRLRRCAAEDCDAVLVDVSRNRSRRYCDVGNCANRAHVAAYRARKAAERGGGHPDGHGTAG